MSWLEFALRRDVVIRAGKTALVVGSILLVINYWGIWRSGMPSVGTLLKMLLTVCVPYCVSTYSSVAALRGRAAATD